MKSKISDVEHCRIKIDAILKEYGCNLKVKSNKSNSGDADLWIEDYHTNDKDYFEFDD